MKSGLPAHGGGDMPGPPAYDQPLSSPDRQHLLAPSPPLSSAQTLFGSDAGSPLMDSSKAHQYTRAAQPTHGVDDEPVSSREKHPNAWVAPSFGARMAHALKAWAPELSWVFLDVLLLIGLVVLLAKFDKHTMPSWPAGLTLNTVVAILSTVSRAMTIIPLVEAMSQLKWNWFASKRRQLRDVYLFDQASRGPWGALVLIFKTRGRLISFAWVASFILVSGLATSFLTQSAIAYGPHWVNVTATEPASVPVAPRWPIFAKNTAVTTEHDPSFGFGITLNAFQAAFYENKTWATPQPHCPSAKCTWPLSSSLAVCASVANVTDRLDIQTFEVHSDGAGTQTVAQATLPSGLAALTRPIDNTTIGVNLTAPPYRFPADKFDDHPIPDRWNSLAKWPNKNILSVAFSQFYLVYSNNNKEKNQKHRFRASEVLFHLCVNTYDVKFNDSIADTKIVSQAVDIENVLHPGSKYGKDESSLEMRSKEGHGPFNVSVGSTFETLTTYFNKTFTSDWDYDVGNAGVIPDIHELVFRNMYSSVDNKTPDDAYDKNTFKNLKGLTGTIADAMTAFMRQVDPEKSTPGQAFEVQTIIHIRWKFLILLIVQIGLTLLFVVAVMIQTARLGMDVVKSSNTAELFAFHAHDAAGSDPSQEADGLRDRGIKTELSPDLSGRLVKGERGWKLKLY